MEEVKTEDRKWCVYMHTNKINNKVYVGITKEYPVERRWRSDGSGYLHKNKQGKYHQPLMARAVLKYSDWNNDWEHIIFADNLSKNKAKQMEQSLIALYNTTNPQFGYNILKGGEEGGGSPFPDERKQQYSEMFKGENNPHYGKQHSQEIKDKIGELRGKPVIQFDKNYNFIERYRSGRNASELTGISQRGIMRCCQHKQQIAGGYKWEYEVN